MLKRAVTFFAGVILLVLGLAGLVLPIIPGLLLLLLAAACFASVSPRLQRQLERNHTWREFQVRWRRGRHLPAFDRLKLMFWSTAAVATQPWQRTSRR